MNVDVLHCCYKNINEILGKKSFKSSKVLKKQLKFIQYHGILIVLGVLYCSLINILEWLCFELILFDPVVKFETEVET